jgi:hypothetical protein
MDDKHKIRHASRMPKNLKVTIIVLGAIIGVSSILLAYLYFPIVSSFIDRKIDFLFKNPESVEEEVADEEDISVEEPEEEPDEEIEEEGNDQENDEGGSNTENGSEEEPEENPEEPADQQPVEEPAEQPPIKQGTAPTVTLQIYEGPLYSEVDDICYYRVLAVVTGDPSPAIIFNKDDSLGSLGHGRAQINISRENPSFTLNATVQNSMGSSSASITLSWNCNRSPDITGIAFDSSTFYVDEEYDVNAEVIDLDGDELAYLWSSNGGEIEDLDDNPTEWDAPHEPGTYTLSVAVTDTAGNVSEASIEVDVEEKEEEPENLDLPRKESEGGYVEYGGSTSNGGDIYAGDSENNLPCSGFVSFDITGISGKTVDSATLTLSGASVSGDPLDIFDDLWIHSLDWGAEPISQGDFMLAGVVIAEYGSPDINCSTDKLKQEIQKAVNDGRNRFQIRIQFGGDYTDDDDKKDGWKYSQSNVDLNVTVSG